MEVKLQIRNLEVSFEAAFDAALFFYDAMIGGPQMKPKNLSNSRKVKTTTALTVASGHPMIRVLHLGQRIWGLKKRSPHCEQCGL